MSNESRQVRRRRLRKGPLLPVGFFPVARNGRKHRATILRITAQIAKACQGKSKEQLEVLGLPTNVGEVEQEVQRRLAASYPAPRMVRSYRPKPSKSDMAAYRKSSGPDLVFA